MNSLLILLVMLAFFLMYSTSKRVKPANVCTLAAWAQKNPHTSRFLAGGLLAVALGLSTVHFGLFAGIFAFGAALMLIASTVILLMPIRLVRPLTVLILAGLIMSAEFVLI